MTQTPAADIVEEVRQVIVDCPGNGPSISVLCRVIEALRAREAEKSEAIDTLARTAVVKDATIEALQRKIDEASKALGTAERQISAAFAIIHPGDVQLLDGSLVQIRAALASIRGEAD